MTRPYETARTDKWVYNHPDETIPFWLKPRYCADHCISWWSDEPTLKEIGQRIEGGRCPACDDPGFLSLLSALEGRRL